MKCFCEKMKIVDFVIVLGVIAALVVGFFTYKHFRATASNQIETTSKIAFQVFLRGVTITGQENPIRKGDDTFISIRNVPYTALKVVNVTADTKKVVMPSPDPKQKFVLVDDYGQAFMYDVVVTVEDTAKITKDGAVVGGNKIKIGLPITLEGKDYKFNGTVSNVVLVKEEPSAPAGPRAQAPKAVQTTQGGGPIVNPPAPPIPVGETAEPGVKK